VIITRAGSGNQNRWVVSLPLLSAAYRETVNIMNTVAYLSFNEINPSDFLPLLNSQKIRKHLIEHELFTIDTLTTWMNSKIEVDSTFGCRVRAVICDGELAGWCGIQFEEGKHEIAIIIDDKFWGLGKKVFQDMMCWAKELGHDEIFIHFLHTRPGYKFLKKRAKNIYESELFGDKFTTYQLTLEVLEKVGIESGREM